MMQDFMQWKKKTKILRTKLAASFKNNNNYNRGSFWDPHDKGVWCEVPNISWKSGGETSEKDSEWWYGAG